MKTFPGFHPAGLPAAIQNRFIRFCEHTLKSAITEKGNIRLVAIVLGFIRTLNRYTNIIGLFFGKGC